MQISLKKGSLTAVADTMGGELISMQDRHKTEYIWQGDGAYWSGRNPILFPIVGKLKDDRVMIHGTAYNMKQHGFARSKEFIPVAQGEDFVELELCADAQTLAQYPFHFSLRVRHTLLENGFDIQFCITNLDSLPMPYCIGAHTAYRCPLIAGEAFEDYQLIFEHTETAQTILPYANGLWHDRREIALNHTDTIPLHHALYDRIDTLVFDGLQSKRVRLLHKTTKRGVEVSFSDFPMIAFWTMPHKNAPYICIEPWQGCAAYDNESGRFEDKPYCVTLQPQQARTLHYTVTILQP